MPKTPIHEIGDNHESPQFECVQCASCCRQEELVVTVTAEDIVRISDGLDLSPSEILRSLDFYVIREGEDVPPGLAHIPVVNTEAGPAYPALRKLEGNDCVFLMDNLCLIHDLRPVVCRAFPFVFKRTSEGLSWGFNAMKEICPGIGQGSQMSLSELIILGNEILASIERHAEFVEMWNSTENATALGFVESAINQYK